MQFDRLKRREFFALVGGAVAAGPVASRAQPQAMPVIGFLHSASPNGFAFYVAAFRSGLKETGYVEGRNVAIEYRWAEGQTDRLPAMAAELVGRQVAVILTDTRSTVAVTTATTTIPIVFTSGGDPVKLGFVASLNRPGGNVTGVSFLTAAVAGKRLELLRDLTPAATAIGYLVNRTNPLVEPETKDVEAAARALGLHLLVFNARDERDFEQAFTTFVQHRVDAFFCGGDPVFLNRRDQLVALAARHATPAIYNQREYVVAGGLMSYGTSISDASRQAGVYVGRILKGTKPADLPVMQSTRFELVINLKTAKSLGLEIPPKVLVLADEVIE